ncbi:thioredoxin [Flavobacterium sp. XGLA_31]|uniref:thioredoxin n=1 Tax=Flavobacterium sp. XGLA_31 TaxID=3447666 RepID=UPI003F3B7412
MKITLLPLMLLSFLIISCQAQQSKVIETIDAKAFAEKLKTTANAQLLDVRTPEEFNADHIDNASNINWYDDDFDIRVEKFDKTKPLFVYCKAGSRSSQAAAKLAELGFEKIYNLDGGLMKWNAADPSKPSSKVIGMSEPEYNGLIKSNKKVLIDFYAEWCGPCRKMAPYLAEMEQDLKGEVTISRIDVDRNPTLTEQLKIQSLPTLIIYENGKEAWRNIGYISEDDLKKHL